MWYVGISKIINFCTVEDTFKTENTSQSLGESICKTHTW